jgi:hypothetical protein
MVNCISGTLLYGQLYFRANVSLGKCLLGKCLSGQMSFWANVLMGKSMSSGQMSFWANVFLVKCLLGKCCLGKCLSGQMYFWANFFLGKCGLGKCSSGQTSYGQMSLGKCRMGKRHIQPPCGVISERLAYTEYRLLSRYAFYTFVQGSQRKTGGRKCRQHYFARLHAWQCISRLEGY